MSEVTYGTGRERAEGKRKGYGKQAPRKGGSATPEQQDRRKQALDKILADAKVRTGVTMAATSSGLQASSAAQRGAMTASNVIGAMQAPNMPRGAWQGSQPVSGHGGAARLARRLTNNADSVRDVTRIIGKWGGVKQAQSHHDETEYERDITFASGASKAEMAKLKVVRRALMMAYGNGNRMQSYAPSDHDDHLHLSFQGPNNLSLQELILGHKSYFA